jgi:hypothetical protein
MDIQIASQGHETIMSNMSNPQQRDHRGVLDDTQSFVCQELDQRYVAVHAHYRP